MEEITSLNNELVKQVVKLQQKKYRDEQKQFLLEGFKPIEEAFNAKIQIEKIFVEKEKAGKYGFIHPNNMIITTSAVLKKISTTSSAPEAVAIAKQKIYSLNDIKNSSKIVLLENIKDLGNLGTILRTAKAFSQDAIILYGGQTVDLYNPKCVRSAVGNLWKIPVIQIKDFKTLKENFGNFERLATLPKGENINNFKTTTPYLVMFGSEADGLSSELKNFASKNITIKMNNTVESLNLSISVGIILFNINNSL